MLFWLAYFSPESLGFFCIRLLVYFIVISFQLLIEFSFIVLEYPILSLLFYHLRYLFNLHSFASSFRYISSCCIVSFSRVVFSFLLLIIPAFCFFFWVFLFVLSFLAVFEGFFLIWISSRNFHPGFDFPLLILEGIPIFSQTNFAPA